MKCPEVCGSWVVLCAGMLLALAPSAHADTWTRAETRHFVVFSNIEQSETRHYLEQLEAFKHLAELILGTDPKDAAAGAKFTIYLLGQPELLKKVRPETSRSIGGYYMHCVEKAQAFVFAPQWFGAELDIGLQILMHEYAHHLMFSRMRRFYPGWYVEGFAEYLGATKLRDGNFQIGVRQEGRLASLQSTDQWLDFEIMLDPKRFSEAVKARRVNAFKYYAQSWLLAHYMLSDSARIKAFNAYFENIGRGKDGVESFEAATGMKVANLRKELGTYRREFQALRVKVPDLPDTDASFTRLPKEQGDYLLEAAALQTCPNDKYGRKLAEQFRAMRAKRPNDVRLRVELSRAELMYGDPKAARAELESLAASEASSFDVAYLLGRSYFDETKLETEEQVILRNKASEQFLKAYALNKTDAANLYFLSRSLDTETAPSKSVVNAGTAAAVLAPSVADYAMHAALVNLRGGDRATAMRVLQPFANHPHKLEYAAKVSALIDSIRENEEAAAVIAKLQAIGLPEKEGEDEDGDDKGKGKDKDKEKEEEEKKKDD
jgi:hypothetical protein